MIGSDESASTLTMLEGMKYLERALNEAMKCPFVRKDKSMEVKLVEILQNITDLDPKYYESICVLISRMQKRNTWKSRIQGRIEFLPIKNGILIGKVAFKSWDTVDLMSTIKKEEQKNPTSIVEGNGTEEVIDKETSVYGVTRSSSDATLFNGCKHHKTKEIQTRNMYIGWCFKSLASKYGTRMRRVEDNNKNKQCDKYNKWQDFLLTERKPRFCASFWKSAPGERARQFAKIDGFWTICDGIHPVQYEEGNLGSLLNLQLSNNQHVTHR